MKKFVALFWGLGLFLGCFSPQIVLADGDKTGGGQHFPMIELGDNGVLNLTVGEKKVIDAVYYEAKGVTKEVNFKWTVIPAILGQISAKGEFVAEYPGWGEILVESGSAYALKKIRISAKDDGEKEKYPSYYIITKRADLRVGEFVDLMTVLRNSEGACETVESSWSVSPDSLGQFEGSRFMASASGKGFIYAHFESYTDSIPVKVVAKKTDPDSLGKTTLCQILPDDTTLQIGQTVQYALSSAEGSAIDSPIVWQLHGKKIGEISEQGLFVAQKAGVGVVKAIIDGKYAVSTRIMVSEDTLSEPDLHTVKLFRVLPNGTILPEKKVREGETYRFGGFPYPLNILNGGLLHFPVGSLKEDLSIFMLLPEKITKTDGDEEMIEFQDSVFAGVKFIVYVDNQPVEPYFFEKPLCLSLVYKHGLLNSLGVDPSQIGMFFNVDGDYTASGISEITIDSTSNRILAQVGHFSTLVLRTQNISYTAKNQISLNELVAVSSFPNPFTQQVTILYQANSDEMSTLSIYNQLGQLVTKRTMWPLSSGHNTFTWDGMDSSGKPANQGIYLGVISSHDGSIQMCKMVKR